MINNNVTITNTAGDKIVLAIKVQNVNDLFTVELDKEASLVLQENQITSNVKKLAAEGKLHLKYSNVNSPTTATPGFDSSGPNTFIGLRPPSEWRRSGSRENKKTR